MRFLRSILVAAAVLFPGLALAQSGCSYIAFGKVLTAAQWNLCFSQKQNVLASSPLLLSGGTMLGLLVTTPVLTNGAGFNLTPGAGPPSSPNNGDVWTTATGMYVQINGSTVGPLGTGGGGGGGSPGGTNGQVQYNNLGAFGGLTNAALTALIQPATASLSGAVPAFPNDVNAFFNGAGAYVTIPCGTLSNSGTLCTLSAAPAGTLTGGTLAAGVIASSLTSVGTLTGGATGTGFTVALGSSTVTGLLAMANGGSNANLTPSNGGIVWSDATKLNVLAGTVTASQCLLSGSNAAPTWGSCSGAAAVSSVANIDGTLTISPTTGSVVASLNLGQANTWTATQTLQNNGLRMLGSSTGYLQFASANAGASNFTVTVPAVTDTLAMLSASQTLSNKTLASPIFTGAFTATGLVTNSDLSQMPATTIKCNNTGSTANVADCVGLILSTTGDGGFQSFVPPTFGGTWLSGSSITSNYTSTHGSDGRTTINIARTTTGSGTNGPGSADFGSFISCAKNSYLSSAVDGECDALYLITAQGNKGDTSPLLTGAYKVRGGASPSGSAAGIQAQGNWIDSSGNVLMSIDFLPSFAEGSGGQSSGTGYGSYAEVTGAVHSQAANQVNPFSGSYVGSNDLNGNCPTHCPFFTNTHVAAGSRNAADIYWRVVGGINQSGAMVIGSGSVNGLDGNPTLSGGTRLTIANVGGTLTTYADNGVTVTSSMSQTGLFALGNGTATPLTNTVNGANSGTNGGSSYVILNGGSEVGAFGNTSGVIGGAYNANITMYSAGTLALYSTQTLSCTSGIKSDATGILSCISNYQVSVVAVASLPTCNSGAEGTIMGVNNANATTFNSTVAGGGTNHVSVYCNGTNWVIGG